MSRGERKAMITRDHPDLSLNRQCCLLSINRSSFYYALKGESPENLTLMRRIDGLFLKYPFYGKPSASNPELRPRSRFVKRPARQRL